MALGNSSVAVTPGAGVTLATQLVSGKEHEVWLHADAAGHLVGSRDLWTVGQFAEALATGGAVRNIAALWNGAGSGVVLEVLLDYQAAWHDVAGGDTWDTRLTPRGYRLDTAPSAGTTRTPVASRSSMAALPAQVVAYGWDVTATPIGDPLELRGTTHAGAAGGSNVRGPHALIVDVRDTLVLAEGEGFVIVGGVHNNVVNNWAMTFAFRVRS